MTCASLLLFAASLAQGFGQVSHDLFCSHLSLPLTGGTGKYYFSTEQSGLTGARNKCTMLSKIKTDLKNNLRLVHMKAYSGRLERLHPLLLVFFISVCIYCFTSCLFAKNNYFIHQRTVLSRTVVLYF